MKYIRGAFWGVVIGGDGFALLLVLSLVMNHNSVMYWLMDTKYGVWYLLGGSAIVGVSFAYSTRNRKKVRFVTKTNPPGVSWGRVLITRVSSLLSPVKGLKEREGKKWKIS